MNKNDLLWLFCRCFGIYFLAYGALGLVIVLQAPAINSGDAVWISLSQSGVQIAIGFYLAFRGEKLLQLCAASYQPEDGNDSATL